MRERVCSMLIFAAGIINFAPVIGIISAAQLVSMYQIDVADPNVEILMRHRAVMFGLIGGFMIFAAFRSAWKTLAITVGLISMLSFVLLVILVGSGNPALTRILYADLIGVVFLLGAAVTKTLPR